MAKKDEQLSDILGDIDIDNLSPEDLSTLYTFTEGFEDQGDEFGDVLGSAFDIADPALMSGSIEADPDLMMTSPNWPFRYTEDRGRGQAEARSEMQELQQKTRIGELSVEWKENGNRWHSIYNPEGMRGPHDPPAAIPTYDDMMDPNSTNEALAR